MEPTPITRPEEDYRLSFVDRILDSVHGYIELTLVEKKIVELPIFKRLQSIKHLSLVSWVFPGAEHTRYSHSLGVMFLIDKMAVQLHYSDGDRQLLRLAGLLHDIGHYPLSHVGESAYKVIGINYDSNPFIQSYTDQTLERIDAIAGPVKILSTERETGNPTHHEQIGAVIIENSQEIKGIIHRNCPFIGENEIAYICDIITGNYNRDLRLSAMIQMLHSELDADRMDYLLRDASFSGTSYGVDIGVLIKNLVLTSVNGIEIVGIKPKGISAADQFLINRFFSTSQVIFNRHVAALEFMAQGVLWYASNRMSEFPKIENVRESAIHYDTDPTFMRFTDHLFWNAVYELDSDYRSKAFTNHTKCFLVFAHMLAKHREVKTICDTETIYFPCARSKTTAFRRSALSLT